jgi:integrase
MSSIAAPGSGRARGHIRQRGSKFQVVVYTGVDPLTGRNHYLRETTDDEDKARRSAGTSRPAPR